VPSYLQHADCLNVFSVFILSNRTLTIIKRYCCGAVLVVSSVFGSTNIFALLQFYLSYLLKSLYSVNPLYAHEINVYFFLKKEL